MAWTYRILFCYVWLFCSLHYICVYGGKQANADFVSHHKKTDNRQLTKTTTLSNGQDGTDSGAKPDGTEATGNVLLHKANAIDAVHVISWVESFSLNNAELKESLKSIPTIGLPSTDTNSAITSVRLFFPKYFVGAMVKGVADIVAALIIEDELQEIAAQLEAIANELAKIANVIDEAIEEIKSSIEFNNWLTAYVHWEFVIQNGEEKLSSTLRDLASTGDNSLRRNLIRDYINYFQVNNIEGAIRNIHRVTGLDSSPTTSNLFQLYSKEKGHDPKELTRLMVVFADVIISGSVQTMAYYMFKYGVERAIDTFAPSYRILDDIRIQYEYHVWYIMRDFRQLAIDDINDVLREQSSLDDELELTKMIKEKLANHFSWFSWAVTMTSDYGLYNKGTYESRGADYIYLERAGPSQNKYIVAVYQAASVPESSCTQVMSGDTLVFLAGTEGRSTDRIVSSENMMTVMRCWAEREAVQQAYLGRRTYYNMPVWIGTEAYEPSSDCSENNSCSGHGQCLLIPSTPSKMCICENSYNGERCENRVEFGSGNFSSSLLASLRERSVVKKLNKKINDGHRKKMDVLSYLKTVLGHADVFNKAEYIKTRYGQFLDGAITADQLGFVMTNFLTKESIDYILVELQNTLLGVGIFDNKEGDILTAYKKAYVARRGNIIACTEQYADDVSQMMTRLLEIDQVICESLIWYVDWFSEQFSSNEQTALIRLVSNSIAEFEDRQNHYIQKWTSESCPTLTVPDLIQNYCTEAMSYEGLSIQLRCNNGKVAQPDKIVCFRNETQLIWSENPACIYNWGEWSDWSACDKTCGGGNQTRVRSLPNGTTDEDFRSCNPESCCQGRHGEWSCANGDCIGQHQVCDGSSDCADGSDEESCDYIRSGDTISLTSACGGYLSCYCTNHRCGGDLADSCLAGDDDEFSRFKIYSTNSDGTVIRHGQTIALLYESVSDHWLSCPGDGRRCKTETCPHLPLTDDQFVTCFYEEFRIMAPTRRGSCDSHVQDCLGNPIVSRDTVYLWSLGRHWLSGRDDEHINTNDCPGQYVGDSEARCPCETWTVYHRIN